MNKTTNLKMISVIIFSLILTSCATTTLQTRVAMTRTIVLDPVRKSDMTVFLRVRNTAASKINLTPILIKDLFKRGLSIVDDPTKAKYILNVNVLFANNLKEAQAIKAAMGAGVNTAIAVGIANNSGKDAIVAGVAAALIGGIIGKATEDETYRAVIDISVKERKNQIIKATHTIEESQATTNNNKIAGFGNEIAGAPLSKSGGGSLNDGLGTTDSYNFDTNYVQHKTRILVSAVKMGLNLKKAVPILEKKAAYEIAEIF
jgi:hypothetical protein